MAILKSTNGAVATKSAETSVAQTAPAPVAGSFTKRVLDTPKAEETQKAYKGRDYDAEARGKVANASFAAALQSPGLAGLGFTNYEEYMTFVRKAADEMVKYSWDHQESK